MKILFSRWSASPHTPRRKANSSYFRLTLTLFNKNYISQTKWENMICSNCKIERLITDFINNQKFCYHCVYQEKTKKSTENQTQNGRSCRMCKKPIFVKKNEKKRQRTVFCSNECAIEGHKTQLTNHWTRKLKQVDSFYEADTFGGTSYGTSRRAKSIADRSYKDYSGFNIS